MLTGTGTDLRIASAAGYDSTGNRVTSQTDAREKTTSYGYSSAMSQLTSQPTTVTDAKNVTRTNVYRSLNSRIKSTSIANTVSLEYTYDSGRLSTMTRKGYIPAVSGQQGQTYTMSYDSFGNMTGVSAGKNYTAYLTQQAIETISWRMSREYSIRILPACTLAEKSEARLPSSF